MLAPTIDRPSNAQRKISRYARDKVSRATIRSFRMQKTGAAGLFGVATVLTALSLTHLSHGIHLVTSAVTWEAWAMAIGIDLGFVAFEFAKIVARPKAYKEVKTHLNVAIVGTLIGSALLNALAFGASATGWMQYAAITFGLSIPALIYCSTRIGATMWLDD